MMIRRYSRSVVIPALLTPSLSHSLFVAVDAISGDYSVVRPYISISCKAYLASFTAFSACIAYSLGLFHVIERPLRMSQRRVRNTNVRRVSEEESAVESIVLETEEEALSSGFYTYSAESGELEDASLVVLSETEGEEEFWSYTTSGTKEDQMGDGSENISSDEYTNTDTSSDVHMVEDGRNVQSLLSDTEESGYSQQTLDESVSDTNDSVILLDVQNRVSPLRNVGRHPVHSGGIRYHIITAEFLTTVSDCLKRLSRAQSLGAGATILGNLIGLGSLYTQDELLYIRDQVLRILEHEDFENPRIAYIIGFVHDWIEITPSSLVPARAKKYKAVRYKNLIDTSCDTCVICFEQFKKNSMCVSMDCLHIFHSKCLNGWQRVSLRCPFCRSMPKS